MSKRKIIHHYSLHDSMNDYLCFYYGNYACSKDHIPPVSYPDDFKEENRIIVRSCLLCNSLLGNKYLLTFLERFDYLLIKYQKRFKKILEMPDWTQDEIEEITGSLKRKVILDLKKKKAVEQKLMFIRTRIINLQGYE